MCFWARGLAASVRNAGACDVDRSLHERVARRLGGGLYRGAGSGKPGRWVRQRVHLDDSAAKLGAFFGETVSLGLRVFVLHPGITPLVNDPAWFKVTRFYPEMCLNRVNTQWEYSQGVMQTPLYYVVF